MESSERMALGNTSTDIVTSALKGTVGAVPIVGSLIAEIVGNVIPNQRVDRLVRFVQLLEERLGNLEEDALRSKCTSEPVVDLLEDAFTQAARATTTERLEHIANVVAYGLSEEDFNQAESKRMLWLLGQLNDAEIVILRSKLARTREEAEADSEFREKHEALLAPDTAYLGSSEEAFEDAALKTSYRQRLHDLGLLRFRFVAPGHGQLPELDDETGMLRASGIDITQLGRMLLRYLNLVPEWYSR